jgi:hypothetical protein
MKPGRFNTPLIVAGGTLLGGGAACYQITGDMFSLSPIIVGTENLIRRWLLF